MNKNPDISISNLVNKIKETVSLGTDSSASTYLPDILEFCNSKRYLNLPNSGIKLHPMQNIILKTFYRGQRGNEHLKLTQEETQILFEEKMQSVLDKYNSGQNFRELVLVLGRRSGKDFMTSLIALYEAMKLLELPGGSPFKYYNIAPGNPIYIITVATSADQARILFNEIKTKMQTSEYFKNRIGKIEADRIWLLTPEDKKLNKELISQGMETAKTAGSVVIMSGHSNSDGLLGKRVFCCAEGSMVLSSQGLLPIESFKNKNDIILHGIDGPVIADKFFDNGFKSTLIIETSSGNKINVTPEHPLFIWSGTEFLFKKAESLNEGDVLVGQYNQNMWANDKPFNFIWSKKRTKYGDTVTCPICFKKKEQINTQHLKSHGLTPSEFRDIYPSHPVRSDIALMKFTNSVDTQIPQKMTRHLARFLGYFISEGNNTSNNFNVTNTDSDVLEDMEACLKEVFPKYSKRLKPKPNCKQGVSLFVFGRKEREFLQYIGCKIAKANNKEIPWCILTSSKKYVAEFLKAYFEGDGYISDDVIFACSTSEKLIRQIYTILLNMGILSTITLKHSTNPNRNNQWLINIRGEQVYNFAALIGFISCAKKNALAKCCTKIKTRKPNKFGFDVSSIITQVNSKNYDKLKSYKQEYGFYGFTKQKTQSLKVIEKWQKRYFDLGIHTPLDLIVDSSLFGDVVKKISPSKANVYDFHVVSKNHSFCCNGLINHNCLLLDEVASFKTTGGATSGDRIYSALGPATADFSATNADGKRVLDSKIVSISSPRAEEGILYKLWADTPAVPRRLAFKLPTWKVNRQFTEIDLRTEFKFMSPNQFSMEFGAEFSGTAGEKFIAEQYISKCQKAGMELGLDQRIRGIPGMAYYAHLDPASTSHNYALIVLHVEERIRIKDNEHGIPTREKYRLFVVDHIKFWQPSPDKAINVHEVDNYIIDLAKRFKFALVTYDEWNSLASIQKLRSKGIPTKATPFRKAYKMSIYNHLEHLMINGQLALPYKGPDAELLYSELKYLKRIYGPQGFKIKPDEEAPVVTDDLCDALAGACGIALETNYNGYAKSGTVYMPQNKSGTDMQWNIGQSSFAPQQWQFLNRKFGKL